MQNVIIYLIGYFGIGKYSIAKSLSELENVKVIDNHYIINPVYALMEDKGAVSDQALAQVWSEVLQVRQAILSVIQNFTSRAHNYVFTDDLANDEGSYQDYKAILEVANTRKAIFVPVILRCELEEYLRRVSNQNRSERMKDTNVVQAKIHHQANQLFSSRHLNELILDITDLEPMQAAVLIMQHIENLSPNDQCPSGGTDSSAPQKVVNQIAKD